GDERHAELDLFFFDGAFERRRSVAALVRAGDLPAVLLQVEDLVSREPLQLEGPVPHARDLGGFRQQRRRDQAERQHPDEVFHDLSFARHAEVCLYRIDPFCEAQIVPSPPVPCTRGGGSARAHNDERSRQACVRLMTRGRAGRQATLASGAAAMHATGTPAPLMRMPYMTS